jgi:hypothetical protein
MKAFGLFGLAVVLFAVLLLGPYIRSFTEGFADATQVQVEASKEGSSAQAEEVKKLGQELVTLNKLLENPTLDEGTREKVMKQKEEVQVKVEKMTKVELPEDKVETKEGFTASNASDLNKHKGTTETFETFR